jgi:ATP-dependent Clp protease ATP-binding subunit ClpC
MHLYLGWAEKRRYEGRVVAEGHEPTRVVLHLSGPGVLGFLSGERGLHRRIEDEARVSAYVRLHRPANGKAPRASMEVEAREVKRRTGTFNEKISAEARARDEQTGRSLSLSGAGNAIELKALMPIVLDGEAEGGAEVRRYFMGRGARVEDPRTGEGTPRVKDVMRGEIDLFIAAWIARPPEEPATV